MRHSRVVTRSSISVLEDPLPSVLPPKRKGPEPPQKHKSTVPDDSTRSIPGGGHRPLPELRPAEPVDLDAVPPRGLAIGRGADVEEKLESGGMLDEEPIRRPDRKVVGVVDDYERLIGEPGDDEIERLELIVEGMMAVVEVHAHTRGLPGRLPQKLPEVHSEESNLPRRREAIDRPLERGA